MMNVEELGDGFVRLTVDGGRVRDKRTRRTYRVVICEERKAIYFCAA